MAHLHYVAPAGKGEAPWLYALGDETFLDLNHYTSFSDWDNRRRTPIMRWHRANTPLVVAYAVIMVISLVVLFTDQDPEGFAYTFAALAAVSVLLFSAFRAIQARRVRVGLIVAKAWSPLGIELKTLGNLLMLVRSLPEQDLGEDINEAAAKLDPDATEMLAKSTLHAAHPDITDETVNNLTSDIVAGIYNTTGLQVERSH